MIILSFVNQEGQVKTCEGSCEVVSSGVCIRFQVNSIYDIELKPERTLRSCDICNRVLLRAHTVQEI